MTLKIVLYTIVITLHGAHFATPKDGYWISYYDTPEACLQHARDLSFMPPIGHALGVFHFCRITREFNI